MADHSNEGSSTGSLYGDTSTSNIELNVKTLDSHVYSFQVNIDIPVRLFKEKIASEIGIPVNQQRLIFRGKVLRDEHALSVHHFENGHTLHLVERQPPQQHATFDTGVGDRPANVPSSTGNEAGADLPLAQSLVSRTFDVGDLFLDLSQLIPDSLTTLSEFMSLMEYTITRNGGALRRVELPTNPQGLPTTESLSIVLRHAQRLLHDHAIAFLSNVVRRLEQDSSSTDPSVRGQIQEESVQVGLRMHQFGLLLLELGRTMSSLHMGQSSVESVVNAGPSVYISYMRPNPFIVEPSPLQTNPLVGGAALPSNPVGAVGIGTAPIHLNIHTPAIGTRPNNGATPTGRQSVGGSTDSGGTHAPPLRTALESAIPHPLGISMSVAVQPGEDVSLSQPSNSVSLSNIIDDDNFRLRDLVGNAGGGSSTESGQAETAGQNSSIGSGAGSEQQSNTKRDISGESGESLPRCNPEIGSDKILNADNVCLDTGRAVNSIDLPTYSSGRGSEFAGTNEENSRQASCEKSSGAGSSRAIPLGLGLGDLERLEYVEMLSSDVKGNSDTEE